MSDSTRITATKTDIDMNSVQALYAERAHSRAGVDVDAPVVLASDTDPKHIQEWNDYEVEHWLPMMKLDESSKVLELGFGTGRIAKYIIAQAGAYVGIDYVAEFCETVRNRKDIKPAYDTDPVFLHGSFRELIDGAVSLPIDRFNRFVISGGVLMYINDEEAKYCMDRLPNLMTDDAVIYISEPVALTERLTLNKFFSENMQSQYSAIYRTEAEYKNLFDAFLSRGWELSVSREFFDEDIKGQKETRQWMFVMTRKS